MSKRVRENMNKYLKNHKSERPKSASLVNIKSRNRMMNNRVKNSAANSVSSLGSFDTNDLLSVPNRSYASTSTISRIHLNTTFGNGRSLEKIYRRQK